MKRFLVFVLILLASSLALAAPLPSHGQRAAFDLYDRFASHEGNVFFSPYSIRTAIGMLYEGAAGKTAEEIRSVFQLEADSKVRREAVRQGLQVLTKSGAYEFKIANALWVERNCLLRDEFTAVLHAFYLAEGRALDFSTDPANSRLTINAWVTEQTRGKINDLISEDVITPLTRLVLTNAVYFKAPWAHAFESVRTMPQEFRVSSGKTAKVPMMFFPKGNFLYLEDATVQVLELPYAGEELAMLLILPKEEALEKFKENWCEEAVQTWRAGMTEEKVNVSLPRFQLEMMSKLNEDLAALGMPLAFDVQSADLSGINGRKDLYVSDVVHKAFIEVTEAGTEAAAATAVVVALKGMPQQEEIKEFRADHPFIFLIQDRASGEILFMGRVSDPSGNNH